MTTQQELVKTILDYNPDTGEFIWKYSPYRTPQMNGRWVGKRAGAICSNQNGRQYRSIEIGGEPWMASHLAFIWMTGEWPKDQVDHKDGDSLNDSWNNLREATQAQNAANKSNRVRGIEMFPNGKWRAHIVINYKKYHLGMYDTKEEALAAYQEVLDKVHGVFSVYNRN